MIISSPFRITIIMESQSKSLFQAPESTPHPENLEVASIMDV